MKISPALRALRVGLVILATLATLAVLFTVEEDWRGRHAWEAEKARLRASGVSLDPALLTPVPIPADQDFLVADTLRPWQAEKPSPEAARRINAFERDTSAIRTLPLIKTAEDAPPSLHSIAQVLMTEGKIKAASDQAAIDEALRRLAPIEPDIRTMRQLARERTQAQVAYPLETNWGPIFSLSQALSTQAILELAEGRRQEAMDDARILLRLIDAANSGPTLLSNLVGFAMQRECIGGVFPAGEKLGEWSDDDLREFGASFARWDEFTGLQRSLRKGEASFSAIGIERRAEAPRQGWARFTPRGWDYLRGVETGSAYEETLSDFDPVHRRFDAARAQEQVEAAKGRWHGTWAGGQMQKIAISAMKEAWIGDVGPMVVALEQYRRAHRAYPAQLGDLVPQYLARIPTSVLTGEPPAYAALGSDHFRLTSAGWKEGATRPEWAWHQ